LRLDVDLRLRVFSFWFVLLVVSEKMRPLVVLTGGFFYGRLLEMAGKEQEAVRTIGSNRESTQDLTKVTR